MPADLHLHTCFSDGIHTPEEIVRMSKAVGLTTIAITDHDVVAGIEPAKIEGEKIGVEVISGIEFTTEIPQTEIHILGYFIDYQNAEFLDTIKKIQIGREGRVYKIVEKLENLGIKIDAEEVFKIAGHRSPGRPHVARVLIAQGYVNNLSEAFQKYLDFHSPAYVSHYRLSPEDAVKLIIKAKGIAVFAHPGSSHADEIIPNLLSAGMRGIEVYYSGHSANEINHYLGLARKYGLLVTGGSDYHGVGVREIELGKFALKDEYIVRIKNEHLRGN